MTGTAEEWNALRNDQYDRRLPRFVDTETVAAPKKVDEVNHPPHYNNGKVECIEAIEASMSKEEYKGYLKGNALKYLWRYNYKGKPQQDLQKAQWYLNKLIEVAKSPA